MSFVGTANRLDEKLVRPHDVQIAHMPAPGSVEAMIDRIVNLGFEVRLEMTLGDGSPLLAVWLGSKVQGDESQPSMGAFAVVIIALIAFSFGLYQLLKLTMRAYQEATGTTPTVRTHAPWLRSMRGERPGYASRGASISGAERVVVVTVLVAALAFEIWFFFLSGSSIGGGGGR